MSAQIQQPHPVQSGPVMPLTWDTHPAHPVEAPLDLQCLQNRITTLETQLQKAIAFSHKKEAYANTLASDLEHIISQLQRLEVVK